jgi:hypothetical protein
MGVSYVLRECSLIEHRKVGVEWHHIGYGVRRTGKIKSGIYGGASSSSIIAIKRHGSELVCSVVNVFHKVAFGDSTITSKS